MKVWVTKDGNKIPYDKLDFNHIYNIIKYALKKGFFTIHTSYSIINNMDNMNIITNCNNEIIQEMIEELKRRNILYAYYIELPNKFKKISPVFKSLEEAHVWVSNKPLKEYIIIKEYLY